MMKRVIIALALGVLLLNAGCSRGLGGVWDDTKTASRYAGKGLRSLGGKHGDSREVESTNDFYASSQEEFVPLQDEQVYRQLNMGEISSLDGIDQDTRIAASRETPGEMGSSLPGIDGFTPAETNPALAGVFQRLHFPYNSSLIKGRANLEIIRSIASYLNQHRDAYVFIEGHCDERGSAAYNLALGSRRSNTVRNLLVKEGVDQDRLFTISYGKERPVAMGHEEGAWTENRRAQFRVFQR